MANDMSPGIVPDRFDITRFFAGRTRGRGVFEDRFGRLRRQFEATFDGRFVGADFVIDEAFTYDDGATEHRQWTITPSQNGHFTATCSDCVGVAVAEATDQSWRMRYDFRLKFGSRAMIVNFDDRVYRVSGRIALNRATISKWGVRIGEVSVVFEKAPADQSVWYNDENHIGARAHEPA
jgi:hypothetical protein